MQTPAGPATEDIDGPLFAAAIGSRQDYYLPHFRRFAAGHWISWNWAAFFGTLAWLSYRKLHGWAWLYVLASLPFLVWWLPADRPEACIGDGDEQSRVILVALIAAVVLIVPPLFANRIYFDRVRALVEKNTPDDVARKGGTAGYAGALVLQAVALLLALVMLPDMKYYLLRNQISEGAAIAAAAAADVQRYQREHGGRLPARLEDATKTSGWTYVSRVELTPEGAVRAIFNGNTRIISGRSIAMVPTGKSGNATTWQCVSDDLVERCLPKECKGR